MDSLPRFWLTSQYVVAKNDQDILDKIFDKNFDLKTIILEKAPDINIPDSEAGTVDLETYTPDAISVKLNTKNNSLFFISDTYFNGWNAYVNGEKAKILRADYTFRAVAIPANSKRLEFKYEPISFKLGFLGTTVGIFVFSVLYFKYRKKII